MITATDLARLLAESLGQVVQCWQEPDGTLLAEIATLGLEPMRISITDDRVMVSDRHAAMDLLESRLGQKLTPADKRMLLRTCLPVGVELQDRELTFQSHIGDILTGLILVATATDKVATGLELLKRVAARNRRKAKTKSKPPSRR